MDSNRPYLLRALNEWILDNGLTPHIIVDVHAKGVQVPSQAIKDGKLVLNINPRATRNLNLGNDAVSFQARFSGTPHNILLPVEAVLAIYARENGQGMMFAHDQPKSGGTEPDGTRPTVPHLKVIK